MTEIANRIRELFHAHGSHTYDETVSMAEHMLQSATLAQDAGASDELVFAALVHDIGHLLLAERSAENAASTHRETDLRHEVVAHEFLARHFPPGVVDPIALHVDAKRYLCAVESEYFDRLSPASVHTLSLQGGPMSNDETASFERNRGWRQAVELRRFDDDAKVVGKATPSVEDFVAQLLPIGGNKT